MLRKYHGCGHPIRVWEVGGDRVRPVFFDGSISWADHWLTFCPHCGERLVLAALYDAPRGPVITLRSWLEEWPHLQQQLTALLDTARPVVRLEVQQALDDFTGDLHHMLQLAKALEAEAPKPANVWSNEQVPPYRLPDRLERSVDHEDVATVALPRDIIDEVWHNNGL